MIILLITFIIINLIISPDAMLDTSLSTLILWLTKVFPSLFPFMVCSSILTKYGFAEFLGILLNPIVKFLFKLRGICSFPIILGLLSGYPIGAKITANMYEDKKITLSEATHLMYFTNNAGPLFLIGTVGTSFFSSPETGYLLLISCFLGAIFSGIIYAFIKPKDAINPEYKTTKITKTTKTKSSESFFEVLSFSISNSLSTIAQICGFMIFFAIFITSLEEFKFFVLINSINESNTMFDIFSVSNEFLKAVFSGIIEMTTGIYQLSISPDRTDIRLVFVCVLSSFGGCSILGQTFAIIKNLPIKKSSYLIAKLINSAISGFIFYVLYNYFYTPQSLMVFQNLHNRTYVFFSINLYIFISFIILLLFIIFILCKQKRRY